jgi:hypothetical protein
VAKIQQVLRMTASRYGKLRGSGGDVKSAAVALAATVLTDGIVDDPSEKLN